MRIFVSSCRLTKSASISFESIVAPLKRERFLVLVARMSRCRDRTVRVRVDDNAKPDANVLLKLNQSPRIPNRGLSLPLHRWLLRRSAFGMSLSRVLITEREINLGMMSHYSYEFRREKKSRGKGANSLCIFKHLIISERKIFCVNRIDKLNNT